MMAQHVPYNIGSFWWRVEDDPDAEFNLYIGKVLLKISLKAKDLEGSESLRNEFLSHLMRREMEDEEEEDSDTCENSFEAMCKWATAPFDSIMADIPPLVRTRQYSLQDCLFPETLHYTASVVEQQLVPVPISFERARSERRLIGALLPRIDLSQFSIYCPTQILVEVEDGSQSLPASVDKVFLPDRQPCFFKKVAASDASATERELATYLKIQAAEFDADVHVPNLRGVVQDKVSNRIVGILTDYIDCGAATLFCKAYATTDGALKRKWFNQISWTLQKLHEKDIIWGDAKAPNVLINSTDDAFLIDFGGGFTPGWVDQELSGTLEGDCQGLEKIEELLCKRVGKALSLTNLHLATSVKEASTATHQSV